MKFSKIDFFCLLGIFIQRFFYLCASVIYCIVQWYLNYGSEKLIRMKNEFVDLEMVVCCESRDCFDLAN